MDKLLRDYYTKQISIAVPVESNDKIDEFIEVTHTSFRSRTERIFLNDVCTDRTAYLFFDPYYEMKDIERLAERTTSYHLAIQVNTAPQVARVMDINEFLTSLGGELVPVSQEEIDNLWS